MNNLETQYRSLAHSVQRWLRVGDALQVVPGEESITDWLLMRLAASPQANCLVKRFTRNAENLNGADFELCYLRSNNEGVGLLIQAKRLYPTEHFGALTYSPGAENQIDKLISAAEDCGCIPMYALYQPPSQKANLESACNKTCFNCIQGDKILKINRNTVRDDGTMMEFGLSIAHPFLVDHSNLSRDQCDLGVAIALAHPLRKQLKELAESKSLKSVGPRQADIGKSSIPLACLAKCYCVVDSLPKDNNAVSQNVNSDDDESEELVATIRRTIEQMPGGAPISGTQDGLRDAVDQLLLQERNDNLYIRERPSGIPNAVGRITIISLDPN